MTTLIIHPDDRSTDFLRPIYRDLKHKTVITGPITRDGLHALIKAHDRIIGLGHGSPSGLFSMSSGGFGSYILGAGEVEVLRGKELVSIWCHANQFMERHKLNGLYSGMFISEVSEARYYGLNEVTQADVNESNDAFARILGREMYWSEDQRWLWASVQDRYTKLADWNLVAEYNSGRWFFEEGHYIPTDGGSNALFNLIIKDNDNISSVRG
jgi:hypothetical protein